MHVICVSCDLPAKALVQNFVQFNGIYGCGFCEQPGEVVSTAKGGNVTTFPYNQSCPQGPPRSESTSIQYATQAQSTYNNVRYYTAGTASMLPACILHDYDSVQDFLHM